MSSYDAVAIRIDFETPGKSVDVERRRVHRSTFVLQLSEVVQHARRTKNGREYRFEHEEKKTGF